ncbi:MAG: isoprenyl transferase [Clostridia bacterium]|nr:isoprenyl transferase [Clostridia bacterium]
MFFKRKAKEIQLDKSRIPQHIGVIMDGNGRWAKRRGLPRSAGHKRGADILESICDYCNALGVKALTVYAFSTENWSRPQKEIDALMDLLYDYLLQVEEKFRGRNMKLKISGDIIPLSEKIKQAIHHAEEVTASGTGMVLNIALNYGGRDEIVRASRRLCADVLAGKCMPDEVDESAFASYLDMADLPEVDLIIRPSGEKRLSNFMLWQAAYAEFWYSDICWPDFKETDMQRAIYDFQNRDRRFGGVKE